MFTSKHSKTPNFIVKSTQLMALLSGLFLLPLFVLNAYNGNISIAILLGVFCFIQLSCARRIYKGNYHPNIGMFAIAPMMFIASAYGLMTLSVMASYWPFLTVFCFYFTLNVKLARIVNIVYLLALIPIAYPALSAEVFPRFYMGISAISVFLYLCVDEIQSQHNALTELSITDPLTGLYNRTMLQHSLQQAIHQHKRNNIPFCLLMVDVDHFKRINDEFGHATGDQVLIQMSSIMSASFRKTDGVFRIGGEEFLILLSGSSRKNGAMVAERLRESIQASSLIDDHTVTVSIGMKELQHEEESKDWMSECDKLLYAAKESGRNQVVCA